MCPIILQIFIHCWNFTGRSFKNKRSSHRNIAHVCLELRVAVSESEGLLVSVILYLVLLSLWGPQSLLNLDRTFLEHFLFFGPKIAGNYSTILVQTAQNKWKWRLLIIKLAASVGNVRRPQQKPSNPRLRQSRLIQHVFSYHLCEKGDKASHWLPISWRGATSSCWT